MNEDIVNNKICKYDRAFNSGKLWYVCVRMYIFILYSNIET